MALVSKIADIQLTITHTETEGTAAGAKPHQGQKATLQYFVAGRQIIPLYLYIL